MKSQFIKLAKLQNIIKKPIESKGEGKFFHSVEEAIQFVKYLNEHGIDISAQTYKANCPPAALTKLPLTKSLLTKLVS